MGLGLRRRLEEAASAHPALRRALTVVHLIRTDRFSRGSLHPFDRAYGVRTQSNVPLYLNRTGSAVDEHIVPYGGCVASVLRRVIERISPPPDSSFVDIGCGKGRALIVASERPFAQIIGIELNPDVAAVARANARRIARNFPRRTAIAVHVGDASEPVLPDGDLVIFMYHPFGRRLVERLCEQLAAVTNTGQKVSVVYENPVHGAVFDLHPAFERLYAAMLPCGDDEVAFAFDPEEAVVVWQSVPSNRMPDLGSGRSLVTIKPDFRVVLTALEAS